MVRSGFELVDRAEPGTISPLIVDTFEFSSKPYRQKTPQIQDLYLKHGLTAKEIAEKFGCSKATILKTLHRSSRLTLDEPVDEHGDEVKLVDFEDFLGRLLSRPAHFENSFNYHILQKPG